jgi:RHS repeat-associated protein
MITDQNQNPVWKWDQSEPFGDSVPNSDPNNTGTPFIGFNARFSGTYLDAETGLFYNYFRYLDKARGQYTQSDLVGLRGGLNTYAHVDSSPLMFTDKLGLQAAAGAVSGGAAGSLIGGKGGACCTKQNRSGGGFGIPGFDDSSSSSSSRPFWPTWMQSNSDSEEQDPSKIIPNAPVPPFPGLQNLQDCTPGSTMTEPALNKRWRGGVSIQQEYFCPCGQITRHTIIFEGVIVHDHFRPGPPKPGGD